VRQYAKVHGKLKQVKNFNFYYQIYDGKKLLLTFPMFEDGLKKFFFFQLEGSDAWICRL